MSNKDKPELNVPTFTPPAYKSSTGPGIFKRTLPVLEQYADSNIRKQAQAQQTVTRGAYDLTEELAPRAAQLRVDLNAKYAPQIVDQYLGLIDQADPNFRSVRDQLGARVASDLNAGYSLGADLQREVEDGIRKGQAARGNWLGPAPTAQEAFGKASAAIDLNNQRQNNARAFLASRAPSDMFASYGIAEGYQPVNVITPTGNYVDAGIPANLAATEAQSQAAYNDMLVRSYAANTDAQFGSYDRQWDRYLYGQAVANGLYSPVSAGGGGGSGWLTGALGGAASGAVVGTQISPGYGTAIGAVVGGVAGGVTGGMK